MSAPWTSYTPSGPVANAFLESTAPVIACMGPFGSGKTAAALLKILVISLRQGAGPDGWKRTRFAVIRDTLRNLERTTIPSWKGWVGDNFGQLTGGSGGAPARHVLRFQGHVRLNGQTYSGKVESEVLFVGLGEQTAEAALKGMELTGAFLDEADGLPEEVLDFVTGRVGRYPAMRDGGPSWSGVWLAFNAPDDAHWLYRRFVDEKPPEWDFFVQPSGLARDAENLSNLPPGYYERMSQGKPDWWIRRFIKNQWGYDRSGKPVFHEYNDALHVAPLPLKPQDGPLVIGADAGLTPAAIIMQQNTFGQWRVLAELVALDAGAKRFGAQLTALLAQDFRGLPATIWCDPSAVSRADTDEKSWAETMRAVTGLPVRPAQTNNLQPRLDAVREPLTRLIDGEPGFVLSPTCKVLRKGFNSGYRFRQFSASGGQKLFDEKPEKNDYSHPMDGLQYGLLGGGEYHEVLGRKKGRIMAGKAFVAPSQFRLFGGSR